MAMTPQQIRQFFENLIDDELDITFTYQLLTNAKNKVESKYKPLILQTVDTSKTASVGDTYLSMKALPTDIRQMIKLVVGTMPYFPVPFKDRIRYRDATRRYYIDWKNRQFALTGSIAGSQTISQHYLIKTDDLTQANETTEGVVLWPDEYQLLIAYEAAVLKSGGIDADTTSQGNAPVLNGEHQELLDGFIEWDADLKLQSMNGQGGYHESVGLDEERYPIDIGLLG